MFSNKEEFKAAFLNRLEMACGKSFSETTVRDQYQTLGNMLREYVSNDWITSNEQYFSKKQKQVYYLSIEYLLGKLLRQNLINLGLEEMIEEGLLELGINLGDIEEMEADAGLGNGGLGRLAACFHEFINAPCFVPLRMTYGETWDPINFVPASTLTSLSKMTESK